MARVPCHSDSRLARRSWRCLWRRRHQDGTEEGGDEGNSSPNLWRTGVFWSPRSPLSPSSHSCHRSERWWVNAPPRTPLTPQETQNNPVQTETHTQRFIHIQPLLFTNMGKSQNPAKLSWNQSKIGWQTLHVKLKVQFNLKKLWQKYNPIVYLFPFRSVLPLFGLFPVLIS